MRYLVAFLFSFRLFALRRTTGFLIVLAILTAVSLHQSLSLEKSVALSESIPQKTLVDAGFYSLKSEFKTIDPIVIRISKLDESAWTEADLCQLKKWHNESLKITDFDFMSTIFDLRTPLVEDAQAGTPKLFFPALITESCTSSIADLKIFRESKIQKIFADPTRNSFFSYLYLRPQAEDAKFDFRRIRRIVNHIESFKQYKISVTGSQIFQMYAKENLDRLNLLNILAIVLILLLLKCVFRTWKSGLVLAGTLLFSIVIVRGSMAFAGHKVDALLSSLFLILAIAVAQDLIFVFDEIAKKKSSYLRASRKLLVPSFFTTLTTVIGFGSLMISDVPNIVRFGGWAAFGALLEWFVVFVFLPVLIKKFPRIGANLVSESKDFGRSLINSKLHPILTFALIIPVFLNPVFMEQLKVNHFIMDSFISSHKLSKITEEIRKSHGWENSINIVFEPGLQFEERQMLLEQAAKIQGVVYVSGPQLLVEDVKAPTYLLKFIADQVYETRWGKFFHGKSEKIRAELFFKVADSQGVSKISEAVNEICKGRCSASGEIIAFARFSRLLLETLKDSYFISLFLVGLLMTWVSFSLGQKNLWIYLLTSAIGPSSIAAVFYFLQIPIDMITSISLSVSVGLAGDNAIQYMFANRHYKNFSGIEIRGLGSLTATFVMIILCLPLFLSDFRSLRWSAVVLILGFIIGFIGDYWALKSLLSIRKIINFNKGESSNSKT